MFLTVFSVLLMMTSGDVPENMAKAVEGCWQLGVSYRVTIRLTEGGLRADEETTTPSGKRLLKDQPVEYSSVEETFSLNGIGAIHRTLIMLRPSRQGLEFAFNSEISPGKWTQGAWEQARRCTADQK